MSEPFMGEVKMVANNFAPKNWAFCNGQEISINEHQALYAVIGTYFGGNGTSTMGLPDLRGRTPVGMGNGYFQGMKSGFPTITLTASQTPGHNHTLTATTDESTAPDPSPEYADTSVASTGRLGSSTAATAFSTDTSVMKPLSAAAVTAQGGNQPHNNMQPYLGLHFVIALEGLFPSRN